MKIVFNNTLYNSSNNVHQNKRQTHLYSSNNNKKNSDRLELSYQQPVTNTPTFCGIFGLFDSFKVDVNTDPSTLSEKELKKMELKTTNEIYKILLSKKSTPELEKRLKELIGSPFCNLDTKPKIHYPLIAMYDTFNYYKMNDKLLRLFNLEVSKQNTNIKPEEKIMVLCRLYSLYRESSDSAEEIMDVLQSIVKEHGISDKRRNDVLWGSVSAGKHKLFNTFLPDDISKLNLINIADHLNKYDYIDWITDVYTSEQVNPIILNKKEQKKSIPMGCYRVLFSYPENLTPEFLMQILPQNSTIYDVFNFLGKALKENKKNEEFLDSFLKYIINNADSKNDYDPCFFMYKRICKKNMIDLGVPDKKFKELLVKNGFNPKERYYNYYDKDLFYNQVQKILEERLTKDLEIYSLEDFERAVDKLETAEQKSKLSNGLWARLVVENLPDIFLTDENKEKYEKIIERLKTKSIDWNYTDKQGNNLAHRAVIAENPLLVKFAVDKDISFITKNSNGETALNLVEKYGNIPEIKAELKDMLLYNDKLFNLVESNIASGVELLLKNSAISVLGREPESKRTPWLAASAAGSVDVMKVLLQYPEMDINAVDKKGDNAAIIAARDGNTNVIKFLNTIEDFNINYVNPVTNESVFTSAKNKEILTEALKNKNANPDISLDGKETPLFQTIKNASKVNNEKTFRVIMNNFYLLSSDSRVNLNQTYDGKLIGRYMLDKGFKAEDLSRLKNSVSRRYIDSVKSKIEADGVLSIEKIKEYVMFPNSDSTMMNTVLNDINEPIGFFLADIESNESNIWDCIEILNKLKEKNYDFTSKNKFGQTLLDKAKDAENSFLVEYLQKNIGVKQ